MSDYFKQVRDQMSTASERLKEVGYALAAAKAEATKKNLDDCIDSIGAAERRVRRAQKFVNRATAAVNDEIEEFLEDNSATNNAPAVNTPLVADSRLDQLAAQLTVPTKPDSEMTDEEIAARERARGEQTAKAIKEAKEKGIWF